MGNIRHERVELANMFERELLKLLGGGRDRSDLLKAMVKLASSEEVGSEASVAVAVDRALQSFHERALLVA